MNSDYDCHVLKPLVSAGVFAIRQTVTAIAGTNENSLGREVAFDASSFGGFHDLFVVSIPFGQHLAGA